ncbi:transposase [Streptomyces virginiae]|uniref:transposase n=1 Tax=Streptomyces virginiae TaxID=1961 RepID=UPI003F4D0939
MGEDEYVLCSDENTSVQARCRCHPTLAPGRARAMRVNHEYGCGGAVAYLAAYDVHRAKVLGRCEPKTGIVPFMALVTQVMTAEPYASARGVFWIVDNGSSHRGKKAMDRLTKAFPNAVMVHTSVHASWTNQIEIFFSIVQRKVVQPNDFTDLTQVRDQVRAFEDATTPQHSRSSGSSSPPTWTICWPDSTDTHQPIDKRNPPSPLQPDHPRRTSRADHLASGAADWAHEVYVRRLRTFHERPLPFCPRRSSASAGGEAWPPRTARQKVAPQDLHLPWHRFPLHSPPWRPQAWPGVPAFGPRPQGSRPSPLSGLHRMR